MPKVRLTEPGVRSYRAEPGERLEYFDALTPGFALRVAGPTKRTPAIRKTWVLFYRHLGIQRRLTLPRAYPDLGLVEARREASEALRLVAAGVDPAAPPAVRESEAPQSGITVGELAEAWLSKGLKGRVGHAPKPRYLEETRRNLENHVIPVWGGLAARDITRRDVVALLEGVAKPRKVAGKERSVGGPIAANHVLSAMRPMFDWAIRDQVLTANPCASIDKPGHEASRDRVLSAAEVADLWRAFDSLSYPFGSCFQMLLLSGQRRSEVAGMRWDEVDLEGANWIIPMERTKTRVQLVPLSTTMLAILKSVPRKASAKCDVPSPYVFTSGGDAPISGYSKAKSSVDERADAVRLAAGLSKMEPWRLHDLRRTCATGLGRLKVADSVVERVLNHAQNGVTNRVYNLWNYRDEKLEALERWAADVRQTLDVRRS